MRNGHSTFPPNRMNRNKPTKQHNEKDGRDTKRGAKRKRQRTQGKMVLVEQRLFVGEIDKDESSDCNFENSI